MCRSCFGICQSNNVSAANASVTTTDNWRNWLELLLYLSRLVIVFLILFGNILFITAITETKLFHSYGKFLHLSYSVSDLIVGLSLVSETVYSLLVTEIQTPAHGRVNHSDDQTNWTCVVAIYTVLIISLERCRGNAKPIQVRTEPKGL